MTQALAIGTAVVDRDGFRGTITKVTEWGDARWYDVRFGPQGKAVRYDSDLTPIRNPVLRCDEDSPLVSASRDISKYQG